MLPLELSKRSTIQIELSILRSTLKTNHLCDAQDPEQLSTQEREIIAGGAALFDSDRLGEIAGLIDVATAANGDVVGEKLQWHDLDQR